MDGEKRDNSGALFVNKRKEKETHPDRQGQITVAGVEYLLSGWCKESKSGEKYISLSVKPKEARKEAPDPTEGW